MLLMKRHIVSPGYTVFIIVIVMFHSLPCNTSVSCSPQRRFINWLFNEITLAVIKMEHGYFIAVKDYFYYQTSDG